ncbi:MAG: hypothetical protein ACWA5A_09345 [Marinibacterium sp.]
MAISKHPVTGIALNDITIKRKALDEDAAVTAHLMRMNGDPFTDIVHKLGTNANRVGEVFSGAAWPKAAEKARKLDGGDLFDRR